MIAVLEGAFSKPRFTRYAINPSGADAPTAYMHNLLLAESIMPCLHVLEVALRNAIHSQLTRQYGRPDWWESVSTFGRDDQKIIHAAKGKITSKSHVYTPDRLISELSFGFWTSLFNARHETELWKALRLAFPRCPKHRRKRNEVSRALTVARNLRNRAAHHDALLWLQPNMLSGYQVCIEVVGWLEPQLKVWLAPFDRFPQTWTAWMTCTSDVQSAKASISAPPKTLA